MDKKSTIHIVIATIGLLTCNNPVEPADPPQRSNYEFIEEIENFVRDCGNRETVACQDLTTLDELIQKVAEFINGDEFERLEIAILGGVEYDVNGEFEKTNYFPNVAVCTKENVSRPTITKFRRTDITELWWNGRVIANYNIGKLDMSRLSNCSPQLAYYGLHIDANGYGGLCSGSNAPVQGCTSIKWYDEEIIELN